MLPESMIVDPGTSDRRWAFQKQPMVNYQFKTIIILT